MAGSNSVPFLRNCAWESFAEIPFWKIGGSVGLSLFRHKAGAVINAVSKQSGTAARAVSEAKALGTAFCLARNNRLKEAQ